MASWLRCRGRRGAVDSRVGVATTAGTNNEADGSTSALDVRRHCRATPLTVAPAS
jgi:hypothetical protein